MSQFCLLLTVVIHAAANRVNVELRLQEEIQHIANKEIDFSLDAEAANGSAIKVHIDYHECELDADYRKQYTNEVAKCCPMRPGAKCCWRQRGSQQEARWNYYLDTTSGEYSTVGWLGHCAPGWHFSASWGNSLCYKHGAEQSSRYSISGRLANEFGPDGYCKTDFNLYALREKELMKERKARQRTCCTVCAAGWQLDYHANNDTKSCLCTKKASCLWLDEHPGAGDCPEGTDWWNKQSGWVGDTYLSDKVVNKYEPKFFSPQELDRIGFKDKRISFGGDLCE